jgi:hypothetical protein
MSRQAFIPLVIISFVPILVYLWFNYVVMRRISRLTISNEGFLSSATKMFSFFFLKFIYVIVLTVQCVFIFHPINTVQ